ncbi:hypothetical protein J6590_095516 [Homalodisca vitripennis]|nr:hypothetical protein J6590_095516 [Homalodisca vitripennis]
MTGCKCRQCALLTMGKRSGYYSQFCISNYCFGVYADIQKKSSFWGNLLRILIFIILLLLLVYVLLAIFAPEVADSIRKKLKEIWQKLTGEKSSGSDEDSRSNGGKGSKQSRKDKSRDQDSDDVEKSQKDDNNTDEEDQEGKKKDYKKRKGKASNKKNNKKTRKSDVAKSKKDSYSGDEEEEEIKNESSKKRKVEQNKREEKKTPKSEAKLDRRSEDNISVASRASSIGRRSPSTSFRQRNVENTRSTSSRKLRERLRNHS